MSIGVTVRDARPDEFGVLGKLLVGVYSSLDGFPTPAQQPHYYELLANIGHFTRKPGARVLAAVTPTGELGGGVVYFGDMTQYTDPAESRLRSRTPRAFACWASASNIATAARVPR